MKEKNYQEKNPPYEIKKNVVQLPKESIENEQEPKIEVKYLLKNYRKLNLLIRMKKIIILHPVKK